MSDSVTYAGKHDFEPDEIWKDIPGYEGKYQVSNLGRVISISRKVIGNRGNYVIPSRFLKIQIDSVGYERVSLCVDSCRYNLRVHTAVAMAFLGHKRQGRGIVIDHIDNNKTNNVLTNLRIVTHRFNSKRKQGCYTSKYKGVYWAKKENKWVASIRINKKLYTLGRFTNEIEAAKAYQKELDKLGEKYDTIQD